jgi:hypothetical protein
MKGQRSATFTLTVTPLVNRTLMHVVQELVEDEEAMEGDAAYLLLHAALANLHLLRPHIDSLRAYCKREKLDEFSMWQDMIKRQFTKKAKRPRRRRKSS